MVNFTETNSLFKYTWEQVAIGLWFRYPNPNSKHVVSEDVISRHVDNNKLFTKRLLSKTNKIPKWGERFIGGDKLVLLVEESTVDLDTKTFTTYTRNIGLKNIMTIEEKCVYKLCPENLSWTLCDRSAWFTSPLPIYLKKPIEIFTVKRFKSNGIKASQGLDFVLNSLFKPETLKDHSLFSASNALREKARKVSELAKSKAAALSRASSTIK